MLWFGWFRHVLLFPSLLVPVPILWWVTDYLSYVPPTHEYGTRPFLRWVRSQSRSPHASGKVKNTFDPVGIPLFGAPQVPGNKPNPSEVGKSLGGMAPWGRRNSPEPRHTRQNRPEIKQPTECNPTTGEERSEELWNTLVTVSSIPITTGIIVTFMFCSFFNSQARFRYLFLFSPSFGCVQDGKIHYSAGSLFYFILFYLFYFIFIYLFIYLFFFLLTIARCGRPAEIR